MALAKTSPLWGPFLLCKMGSHPSTQGWVGSWEVLGCLRSSWPHDPSVGGSASLHRPLLSLARLLGVDKVLGYALNEWLQDIRKNQLPGLLGGVGPMHSVVQLCECLALGALETAYNLGQPRNHHWE